MKKDAIAEFLEGYAAARIAGNRDAVEAHYAVPLIVAGRAGTTFVEDEDALHGALDAEMAGGNPTAFDPYDVAPLPDGAARVRARVTWADGSVAEKAYTLAEDDDGVIAIVAVEVDG